MIQIKPLIFPTVGTASAVVVNCQTFEMLSLAAINFNVRFFEESGNEIFNTPIAIERADIKEKSEEEIISFIFEALSIEIA